MAQRCQIVFILGVELARGARLIVAQHPVDPDHRVVAAGIFEQKVIEERIEAVRLDPRVMIDPCPGPAKFGHKDVVPQTLRCPQIGSILRQPH